MVYSHVIHNLLNKREEKKNTNIINLIKRHYRKSSLLFMLADFRKIKKNKCHAN